MESLLPYYERELTFLRRLSQDFARRHPKVAGRLLLSGEACEDPHIERLIESFAFLAARIHRKLDDDYPEITDSLMQVVYPQYLRPFPAATIAHFDCGTAISQLTGGVRIVRGTLLDTRPVRGAPCRFRSAYEVEIWPVQVAWAGHETAIDGTTLGPGTSEVRSLLRIDLESVSDTLGFDALGIGRLRFFLNGDPSVVALIREALFARAAGVWVCAGSMSAMIQLPQDAIRPVGFDSDETLLEHDARVNPAHQLLLEYFSFPEKFNFFDLDLSSLAGKLPPSSRRLELRIGLRGGAGQFAAHLLDRIGKDNFLLGCTPAVNLFRQFAEPIRINHAASSYPVVVDSRRPQAYEIYDIRRVARVRQTLDGEEIDEFRPFYSIRHSESTDAPARYWHAVNSDDGESRDYTMEIALVDGALDLERQESNTLSIDLLCTNRDLPSQLPFGLIDGDLFIEGGSVVKTVRMLRKPSRSHRFPRGRGAQWRLVSHLSLNHLSLAGQGGDALKEMLSLYDIARIPANARQIAGVVGVQQAAATERIAGNPFPVFVRGLEIRLTVDETHYSGIGLFMFAQVLSHFFALYVHANSFTRLVVFSKQSGQELIRCPARSGESMLA